jgi:hypothetical protein
VQPGVPSRNRCGEPRIERHLAPARRWASAVPLRCWEKTKRRAGGFCRRARGGPSKSGSPPGRKLAATFLVAARTAIAVRIPTGRPWRIRPDEICARKLAKKVKEVLPASKGTDAWAPCANVACSSLLLAAGRPRRLRGGAVLGRRGGVKRTHSAGGSKLCNYVLRNGHEGLRPRSVRERQGAPRAEPGVATGALPRTRLRLTNRLENCRAGPGCYTSMTVAYPQRRKARFTANSK